LLLYNSGEKRGENERTKNLLCLVEGKKRGVFRGIFGLEGGKKGSSAGPREKGGSNREKKALIVRREKEKKRRRKMVKLAI